MFGSPRLISRFVSNEPSSENCKSCHRCCIYWVELRKNRNVCYGTIGNQDDKLLPMRSNKTESCSLIKLAGFHVVSMLALHKNNFEIKPAWPHVFRLGRYPKYRTHSLSGVQPNCWRKQLPGDTLISPQLCGADHDSSRDEARLGNYFALIMTRQ